MKLTVQKIAEAVSGVITDAFTADVNPGVGPEFTDQVFAVAVNPEARLARLGPSGERLQHRVDPVVDLFTRPDQAVDVVVARESQTVGDVVVAVNRVDFILMQRFGNFTQTHLGLVILVGDVKVTGQVFDAPQDAVRVGATEVEHLEDTRTSTVLFNLTQRLVMTKWREPGEEPKLHLFGQLKRIAKQWLDGYLVCKGGTYPAQLMYQELADMACERITAAITRSFVGDKPIKALLDPYNPTGSTMHVNFNTSKTNRWKTDPRLCHINWAVLDSDWEGEFCRVAESHPRVRAYVKNHSLGFEVPYRYGSTARKYRPDFIVRLESDAGELVNLIVEIKGYQGEDVKDKRSTMHTYWVPGVNNLKTYGRWAFAEFADLYQIEEEFYSAVETVLSSSKAVYAGKPTYTGADMDAQPDA